MRPRGRGGTPWPASTRPRDRGWRSGINGGVMSSPDFNTWAAGFRAEAAADDYRIAAAGWDRGCVSIQGERDPIQKWRARELVRDTIDLASLVVEHLEMDGREGAGRFLELQTYDPA